jgi:hypothetical protein
VFSPWRKKVEGIGKLLEMVPSPIGPLFCYWGWDRGAAEVALMTYLLNESTLLALKKQKQK